MPEIVANGIRMGYHQIGAGPCLVFVHGLATNRAFWYVSVARWFARHYRVVMFDLRGHGASEMPPSGYTPDVLAGDLKGLLDALDVPRAHVVGHSFGGAVAMSFAARNPERVSRLVIADTRLNSLQPTQRLGDSPHLTPFEASVVKSLGDEAYREDHIGLRFLEEAVSPRFVRERVRSGGGFTPFAGLNGSPRGVQRWQKLLKTTSAREEFRTRVDITPDVIRAVRQPTLLVYGDQSRCLPTYDALAQLLPNCRQVLIPNAGHFHPMTRPRLFNRTVRSFLAMRYQESGRERRPGQLRRQRAVFLEGLATRAEQGLRNPGERAKTTKPVGTE